MKKVQLINISDTEYKQLLKRPAINFDKVYDSVKEILANVKREGDSAVLNYCKKFDSFVGDILLIGQSEIAESEEKVLPAVKGAIETAAENILKFHKEQLSEPYKIETMPGVKCSREYRPIESVGLYIPGGTAVLPSTMLMLGLPAKIAGCKRIVACTPVGNEGISPVVLYAAKVCGIQEIYSVGGAQAIGMLAYGTESVQKVDKIFGPGNQYVTTAKSLVSIDPDGCAIDMPAGPSEVLIIADEYSNPRYIAADMLSQAEHGYDSQAVCIATSSEILEKIESEITLQLENLPRKQFASESIKNSLLIDASDINTCLRFSNNYAPEHLIIHTDNAIDLKDKIINAGSVFIGKYSPESVGDYASGTNHSLPTYGYAKAYSGVNVMDYMKAITFQELSREGLINISETVITLAETEELLAHAKACKSEDRE